MKRINCEEYIQLILRFQNGAPIFEIPQDMV
jgi:hypothetical protein